MRVLHIMTSAANGGAEIYSTDMMASLAQADIDQVCVLSRHSAHAKRLVAAGVPVDARVLDIPLSAARRWRLRARIAAFAPDIVHCWMRRAASLAPALDIPVIGWFGGYYEPRHFARCGHLVGVSPDIVRHIVEHGVPAERAHCVPTFPTLEEAPAVDRASLATAGDATVLLTLSRLHPKKGLDVLLAALVGLPRCIAWLAGDGPLEAELRAQADRLGIADRVRFLGWRTDRGALLRAADMCVLPSRWEPFGTVMLEAWAAGTPLVCAAAQGPSALIRDGHNGLLVPVDDAAALAGAIRRLAAERDLRARLIAEGAREYERDFTRPAATRRMLDLYASLAPAAAMRGSRAAKEPA